MPESLLQPVSLDPTQLNSTARVHSPRTNRPPPPTPTHTRHHPTADRPTDRKQPPSPPPPPPPNFLSSRTHPRAQQTPCNSSTPPPPLFPPPPAPPSLNAGSRSDTCCHAMPCHAKATLTPPPQSPNPHRPRDRARRGAERPRVADQGEGGGEGGHPAGAAAVDLRGEADVRTYPHLYPFSPPSPGRLREGRWFPQRLTMLGIQGRRQDGRGLPARGRMHASSRACA